MSNLTDDERMYHIRSMFQSFTTDFETLDSDLDWKEVSEMKGLSIFRQDDPMCEVQQFKATLDPHATFDEVYRLLGSAAPLRLERKLKSGAVDYQVLHQLVQPNDHNPAYDVRLAWACFNHTDQLKNRDYCFVEHSNITTDDDGNRQFILYRNSIDLDECVDLKPTHDVIRGNIKNLLVFREVEGSNVLKASVLSSFDLKGKMPHAMREMFNQQSVSILNRIKTLIYNKRLRKIAFLTSKKVVPKKLRSCCDVCGDKFGFFTKKKHSCRVCGEVVCKSCSKTPVIDLAVVGKTKVCICNLCERKINCNMVGSAKGQHAPMMDDDSIASTINTIEIIEELD